MARRRTRVLSIASINPPHVDAQTNLLDWFNSNRDSLPQDQVNNLLEAAHALQTSSIPVAFPTETVYGLGADATRSEAVRGVYTAKNRPSDNPLIVHVGSLDQLRSLLRSPARENGSSSSDNQSTSSTTSNGSGSGSDPSTDPIPPLYHPLIRAFWPGPLTLLFPVPHPTPFAAEVTSSLHTVGIRMPSSPLARLLISLADRPLAAPSANASTRPSPTTAAHVLYDLDGRIDLILDGGGCDVGVESTVLDGLVSLPVVLRPGGVGVEEIRALGGVWRGVGVGWERKQRRGSVEMDGDSRIDGEAVLNGEDEEPGPRAPGMKYRHYAPTAQVYLFEEDTGDGDTSSSESAARAKMIEYCRNHIASKSKSTSASTSNPQTRNQPLKLGLICTSKWRPGLGFPEIALPSITSTPRSSLQMTTHTLPTLPTIPHTLYSIALGPSTEAVARGLFGALRELDDGVGCVGIFVEGLNDLNRDEMEGKGSKDGGGSGGEGGKEGKGLAAAVMNRLRKAASGI